ncbi:Adenylate kinase [Chitinophaga terrae (ex Kim and Jung 2007)]|uniref:Adenylate kinase n=1 Tax=Chitinophaga terrae (ex Kim and Jung 2007) TaxID=408074 RepID=A0A1H4ECS8_9BACT|nr:adenylate kinase [Chitinophaga terrae (ex Kim and Jung 2007)]MDQ0105533.1 adenylate kinase [Chitinophaga terrae (ex Kim and Jung 2007)]GEP91574.1 adenylate kinase [Chitinophaga terrae (ex Kim and Jung 2007)]SEA82874.1 Adenylate kinase [Chitinophaga terrae (ex Kim and Jung 2007)]
MVNLILFGPPGSGKGTQSANIIQKYGLIHLSTGDLLRSEISEKTPLGMEAKKFMDQGHLVPDEVVIGMISSKLDANPNARGFIFDGFPRTTAQAEALDKLLALKKTAISSVLSLEVPEDALIKRLLNRGLTSGRPDDASEEVVKARIVEYHNKTAPVADHYAKFGKFKKIKGDGTEAEVFDLLSNELDELIGQTV